MTVYNNRNARIRIDRLITLLMAVRNLTGDINGLTSTLGVSDLKDTRDELDKLIAEWEYGVIREEPVEPNEL